jgi:inhibitor of KinA
MSYQLTFKRYNESSILMEWPAVIDKDILEDITIFKKRLQKKYIKQKVEVITAYNSLLIDYLFTIDNFNGELLVLKSIYSTKNSKMKSAFKLWEIPVCYAEEFGTDFDHYATQKNLSKEALIKLHSQAIYTVFFIGFLPGFLYLGGLDSQLHFDRKATPNLNIKKGAVGIGGNQTGIYPQNSPGGWSIIGNSPIDFFDVKDPKPCFANAGDKVKFVPISMSDYYKIKEYVQSKTYNVKSALVNG